MKKITRKISSPQTLPVTSQVIVLGIIEVVFGAFLVLCALGIFLKLGDRIIDKEIIMFDTSILHWAYSIRTDMVTTIMKGFTFLGSEIFLGSAIVIVILVLLKAHKKDAFLFSFILFFGIGLNLLLKALFQRPRPDLHPLVHESTYSFPSGHAMNSFVFYMALSYFIYRHSRNKKRSIGITLLLLVIVGFISFSRIYLGAHYPSDVLAGYMGGIWWFFLVLLIEKILYLYHVFYPGKKN